MKKALKRLLPLFVLACTVLCAMPVQANADSGQSVTEETSALPEIRTGSITLIFEYRHTKIDSGSIELIQVADLDASGESESGFVYTEAFRDEKMPLENLMHQTTARELDGYARENRIKGTIHPIRQGKAVCRELPAGLYLIRQKDRIKGFSDISPFLLSVPRMDENGEYVFDVRALPKTILEEIHSSSSASSFSSKPSASSSRSDSKSSSHSKSKSSSSKPKGKSDVNTAVIEHTALLGGLFLIAALGAIILAGIAHRKKADHE